LIAVVFLVAVAVIFGLTSILADMPVPPQQSSSDAYFTYPPSWDSGWVDIRNMRGQNFTLKHGLNTTNVLVEIRGNQGQSIADGALAWNRTYGGTNGDFAFSLAQTTDGGYVVAGQTSSFGIGNCDFWLVKTDLTGNIQWNQTYGGTDLDFAYSAVQTIDHGYALAGYTSSYGAGASDFWLIKTDAAGNAEWNRTYGGASEDIAHSLTQTSDGGYAIAGITYSYGAGTDDFWLVKTDSAGTILWNKTFGGTSYDFASSVIETRDGGLAITGYTHSFGVGQADFWLVKTDSEGNAQWNQTYDGGGYDTASSVIQTRDGGYALSGSTQIVGQPHFWLVKTDVFGVEQWNKTYGGAKDDSASSVTQTFDGGYILAGQTDSFGAGSSDFWLIKTDAFGNTEWNNTYGGARSDIALSVIQTDDGGYALVGSTYSFGAGSSDFWLMKTDIEVDLTCTALTRDTITIYRGKNDVKWDSVRVRTWVIGEPAWQFGDINRDGMVNIQDVLAFGKIYGKAVSLLSVTGIIILTGFYMLKTQKQKKKTESQ
jgi:hypothetical protein